MAETLLPAMVKSLTPVLERGACPHLAVLLRSEDELYPVLASFYALGSKRGGRLVHRSLHGESVADRGKLTASGLDAAVLDDGGRFSLVEFDPDEPPEASPLPWQADLQRSLDQGFSALWYSRFAIGSDEAAYQRVVPFERAWDDAMADLPVVTLCPYIVGGLDGAETLDRLQGVAQFHEGVLVAGSQGFTMLSGAGHSAA